MFDIVCWNWKIHNIGRYRLSDLFAYLLQRKTSLNITRWL